MPASIATTVHTCCQFNSERRNSFDLKHRRARFTCRNASDGAESGVTETSTVDLSSNSSTNQQNPFASGKISSRVSVKRAEQDKVSLDESKQSPPQAAPKAAFQSSRVSPRAFPKGTAKAFPAPSVASPFDGPEKKKPARSFRGVNPTEVDERTLASRKQILDDLYKEKKQERKVRVTPSDIFNEPKVDSEGGDFDFELIRGTKPIYIVLSFSLIVALMLGTAFFAWKLGAFHYDEL